MSIRNLSIHNSFIHNSSIQILKLTIYLVTHISLITNLLSTHHHTVIPPVSLVSGSNLFPPPFKRHCRDYIKIISIFFKTLILEISCGVEEGRREDVTLVQTHVSYAITQSHPRHVEGGKKEILQQWTVITSLPPTSRRIVNNDKESISCFNRIFIDNNHVEISTKKKQIKEKRE